MHTWGFSWSGLCGWKGRGVCYTFHWHERHTIWTSLIVSYQRVEIPCMERIHFTFLQAFPHLRIYSFSVSCRFEELKVNRWVLNITFIYAASLSHFSIFRVLFFFWQTVIYLFSLFYQSNISHFPHHISSSPVGSVGFCVSKISREMTGMCS